MSNKSGTAFFWGKKRLQQYPKWEQSWKTKYSLKTIKKHRFLNLDMSKTSGTASFWGKTAPAAISKVGIKLARFQNAPHRVVTFTSTIVTASDNESCLARSRSWERSCARWLTYLRPSVQGSRNSSGGQMQEVHVDTCTRYRYKTNKTMIWRVVTCGASWNPASFVPTLDIAAGAFFPQKKAVPYFLDMSKLRNLCVL